MGAVNPKNMKKHKKKFRNTKPYKLYALELEDGFWYIGMATDVEKRYAMHVSGLGAQWTRLHKPVRIAEIRQLQTVKPKTANKYEDMMTLDYALQYGEASVRGGQYCRVINPHYPKDK